MPVTGLRTQPLGDWETELPDFRLVEKPCTEQRIKLSQLMLELEMSQLLLMPWFFSMLNIKRFSRFYMLLIEKIMSSWMMCSI